VNVTITANPTPCFVAARLSGQTSVLVVGVHTHRH
jgi:hypothetical protein